jgi:hypothetical protein
MNKKFLEINLNQCCQKAGGYWNTAETSQIYMKNLKM